MIEAVGRLDSGRLTGGLVAAGLRRCRLVKIIPALRPATIRSTE